jgi:hypothetical protein
MPATPSHFKRPRVVNHTIDFYGVDVKFVYDANKLRDSWIQEWSALEEESQGGKLNEMLDDLIISWDIVNDDGSRFPKTAETIGDLFTIPDKSVVLRELMTAVRPSSEEGNASSTSSVALAPAEEPSKPDSPSSQNGSETLQPQTVSESPSTS